MYTNEVIQKWVKVGNCDHYTSTCCRRMQLLHAMHMHSLACTAVGQCLTLHQVQQSRQGSLQLLLLVLSSPQSHQKACCAVDGHQQRTAPEGAERKQHPACRTAHVVHVRQWEWHVDVASSSSLALRLAA
jgi:hypothetical protein